MNIIPKGYYALLYKERKSKTVAVSIYGHPNVITYGKNFETAESNANEALNGTLEAEFHKDFVLPKARKPRAKRGQKVVFIKMKPEIYMAFLLREWRRDAGFTQKEMASRLDISYQAYQRMERPGRSNLTVETLSKIARSLNGELIIELKLPARKSV